MVGLELGGVMAGTNQDDQNSGPGGSQEQPGSPQVQEPGRLTESSLDASQVETPPSPPGGPAPAPSEQTHTSEQQPPRTDWRDRRIGELTARTREMRAELERLRAIAGQGQQPPNGQQPPPNPPPYNGGPPNQVEIDRQIQERAAILAANQEFNRRCNEVAETGRRDYPDFDTAVSKLVGLVDGNDPVGVANYNSFLTAAMETGEAPKILHALGGDLNEASRILSLNPVRMAVELTRMASRPVQEISRAPRPINPASTAAQAQRTSTSPDDPGSDQMSTAEWMRRREEQIAARNVRR